MKKRKKWRMPAWMRRYLPVLAYDEATIVELMNDHETNVQINAPRALMCVSVKASVTTLERMWDLHLNPKRGQ